MGEADSSHAGIDLDTISIKELLDSKDKSQAGALRSDPADYRVFVNSIFKKMKGQEAFLSFSQQITNVNQILTMKYSSANDIADVILKDMALTSQVLKLVNSSFYRHFSKKGISTISEAMIILGTDEVRSVAASLKIYEMMKDLANSKILKDKTLKGLQRSIMAQQILDDRGGGKGTDDLQIATMVYDMGEYLVALFDPESYIRVELAMEEKNMTRAEASKSIFGLSYSDLGRVAASKLNFPGSIIQAMRPVTRFNRNGKELSRQGEVRYLCAFIQELCDIPMSDQGKPLAKIGPITDKYRSVLGIDLKTAVSMVEMSHEKMVRHAELLKVEPVQEPAGNKFEGVRNQAILQNGFSQIQDALKEQLSIHEIFTRIVEIISTSFYFNQVIISIKKKETGTMEPRFIKGESRPEASTRVMGFKIQSFPDLFNHSILQRTDMVVRNVQKEAYKKQVPDWYMNGVVKSSQVKGFALLPVFVDDKILSMIYVDWDESAPDLNPATMEHLRAFRELMIKTFIMHSR
jgi:HD-like signal output (HDOD) protein